MADSPKVSFQMKGRDTSGGETQNSQFQAVEQEGWKLYVCVSWTTGTEYM